MSLSGPGFALCSLSNKIKTGSHPTLELGLFQGDLIHSLSYSLTCQLQTKSAYRLSL